MNENQKVVYNGISYFHPGLLLKEFLDSRRIEQKDFAQRMGFSEKHISYILTGKADITSAFAEKIAITLGETASTWLNLQTKFDIIKQEIELKQELSRHIDILKNFPIDDMIKNKLIKPVQEKWQQLRELMSFFGVGEISKLNLFSIDNYSIRYRKLNSGETKEAKAVLFRWGEKIASNRLVPPYKKDYLEKAVENIRNNMCIPFIEVLKYIKDELEKAGVIFIFTPKISNASASGYSYKYKGNPVILITYRNKQLDTFWFSLFHEIYHVLNEDFDKEENIEIETNANKYAKNKIIPLKEWTLFWIKNSKNITKEKISTLASLFMVPKASIVGRLQNEKFIKQYEFLDLKEKMNITVFDGMIFEEENTL